MASTSTFSARSQSFSQPLSLPATAAPVGLLGRFLFVLIFLRSAPMHFAGIGSTFWKGASGSTAVWTIVCAVLIVIHECQEGSKERQRFRGAAAPRNSEGLTRQGPDAVTTVAVR